MTLPNKPAQYVAMLGAAAALVLTGCAHNRRMMEIQTFEAGYFQQLQNAEYDHAYELLHSNIRDLLPIERYRTFFTVLTDTLGPMKAWQRLPNPHDHVPLLEKERRQDPLPPDNPKTTMETRYRLAFEKGVATLIIRTGWEGDRLAIRRQFLCCVNQQTSAALQARATTLGVGDLFGIKTTPPPAAPNNPFSGSVFTPPAPAP